MGCLEGKAVIVTGAGQGLGAAYARHAAGEGAAVVVNDIARERAERVAAGIREGGGRALAHAGDVGSWDGAKALVGACVTAYGRLDGLVNNAGRLYSARPEQEDEAALRAIVECNLLGTYFCGVHASGHMLAHGGGAIVNVTSGAQSGLATLGAYGATKGAVASLTYAWALDLGPHGIRVNAISPVARSTLAESGRQASLARGEKPRPQPTAPPEAVAPLVSFLLSDRAAGIEGQVVRLDGRRLALMAHPLVAQPVLERDSWSVANLEEAFASELRAHLMPCGVRTASVQWEQPQ
jgi:NAD(P)-dependent dehydrogenase (short-subunit alcohol dehydrogenase family)